MNQFQLHPLHSPEWVAQHVLGTGQYPGPRGTGRTTALAFELIAEALRKPGVRVYGKDHHESHATNCALVDVAVRIIRKSELKHFKVYNDSIQFG